MHELKIFVAELVTINRFPTSPIVVRKVSSLVVQGKGVRLDPRDGISVTRCNGARCSFVDSGFGTHLAHEPRNNAVEGTAFEPKPGLSSAKLPKVFGRLRNDIRAKHHHNAASGLISNSDIKVAFRQVTGWRWRLS